jgi:hypothetical protein
LVHTKDQILTFHVFAGVTKKNVVRFEVFTA